MRKFVDCKLVVAAFCAASFGSGPSYSQTPRDGCDPVLKETLVNTSAMRVQTDWRSDVKRAFERVDWANRENVSKAANSFGIGFEDFEKSLNLASGSESSGRSLEQKFRYVMDDQSRRDVFFSVFAYDLRSSDMMVKAWLDCKKNISKNTLLVEESPNRNGFRLTFSQHANDLELFALHSVMLGITKVDCTAPNRTHREVFVNCDNPSGGSGFLAVNSSWGSFGGEIQGRLESNAGLQSERNELRERVGKLKIEASNLQKSLDARYRPEDLRAVWATSPDVDGSVGIPVDVRAYCPARQVRIHQQCSSPPDDWTRSEPQLISEGDREGVGCSYTRGERGRENLVLSAVLVCAVVRQ